jgi:hypothetical protein
MAAIEQALTKALVELKTEKARLESAIAQLQTLMSSVPSRAARQSRGRSAKPRAAAKGRRPLAKGAKGRRSKKTSAVALKILSYIKAHPGQRMEHISKGIGVRSRKLKYVVKRLVVEKQVKVRGKTRGRTYVAA